MKKVDKYIVDGMVAVIFSPYHSTGWSTWALEPEVKEKMLFDPEIVQLILDKNTNELAKTLKNKYGNTYIMEPIYSITGSIYTIDIKLEVMWIKEGTPFNVREYDGKEYIELDPKPQYIA